MQQLNSTTLLATINSAAVGRVNSDLKFVKSDWRSTTGEERLNALLLLYIHRDLNVNIDDVIDTCASKHARCIRPQNSLKDQWFQWFRVANAD
jgi:triphosphoribosyl-dephospho-CoA synthetase